MTKTGIIESISVQGHNIYAVIRYEGDEALDMMGNKISIGRTLVGAPSWAPESTLTMSDLLIPLNISSAFALTDINNFIHRRVAIIHDEKDGYPLYAYVIGDEDSRYITRRKMFEYRNSHPDGIIDRITRHNMIEEDGLNSSMMDSILGEVYDPTFHKGYVGYYGDSVDSFMSATDSLKDRKDFSLKVDSNWVSNLIGEPIKKRLCHKPTTIFTGKI